MSGAESHQTDNLGGAGMQRLRSPVRGFLSGACPGRGGWGVTSGWGVGR